MRAAVFAAGLGKRLRPLTNARPKHLLPLAGKPILRRVLEALLEAGVKEVGIVASYMEDVVKRAVKEWGLRAKIEWISQGEAKGTGHALLVTRRFLREEEHFIIVYGDITLRPYVLKEFLNFFRGGGADGVVEGVWVKDASQFGRLLERDGFLVRVEEKSSSGPGLINAGLYILPKKAIELAEKIERSPRGEYELTDVLNLLAAEGWRIAVHSSMHGWWRDIGRPRDLLEANLELLAEELGARIRDESGIEAEVEAPSIILRDVEVGENSRIGPEAVLMDEVRVGGNSRIESSILLDSCSIGEGCLIRRAIIGDGAHVDGNSILDGGEGVLVIAPGARVQAGTILKGELVYP